MRVQQNKQPISPENALFRAAALCSRCEQAEADIRAKLSNWNIDNCDIEKIIARLYSENYLNEQRYAHAFVRDKFRFAGWGKIKITYAMRQKHISSDAITDALTEIDDADYMQSLTKLLKAKQKATASKEPYLAKAALFRFGASRGFEPAKISLVLSKLLNTDCDEFATEY